jgi:hypothetical protein
VLQHNLVRLAHPPSRASAKPRIAKPANTSEPRQLARSCVPWPLRTYGAQRSILTLLTTSLRQRNAGPDGRPLSEPASEFLTRFDDGDYAALAPAFAALKVKHLLAYTEAQLVAEARELGVATGVARALYNALHPPQGKAQPTRKAPPEAPHRKRRTASPAMQARPANSLPPRKRRIFARHQPRPPLVATQRNALSR